MKRFHLVSAAMAALLLAAHPAAAKTRRPPPGPSTKTTDAAGNTVILPDGVRQLPNGGLCRERPPPSEVAAPSLTPARPPSEPRPSAPVVTAPPKRAHGKGTVVGVISLAGASDAANSVVYISGVPGGRPGGGKSHPQVFQRDLAFVPAVNVVTVGTTIDFPNEDRVFHNIFSVSEPAKFDLGLYKAGESRSFTFNRPGTVDVYCNIHPQMVSAIKVLDTTFYAVTAANGKFRIEDVPEGKYKITAWHSGGPETSEEVEVKANSETEHPMTVTIGGSKSTHLRKDGTPYGRYK